MKYKAHLIQDGEGCDYTIACGQEVIDIDADNLDDAMGMLVDIIQEEYINDRTLFHCELYEITDILSVDLDKVYNHAPKKEKAQITISMAEYERLTKKYEDKQ